MVRSTIPVRMRREIRRWRLHERSDKTLTDLARMLNAVIQGWVNCYGRFSKSMLYPTFRHLNEILVRWAMRKYKRLRFHTRRARLLAGIARREPGLFAHWKLGVRPDSWTASGLRHDAIAADSAASSPATVTASVSSTLPACPPPWSCSCRPGRGDRTGYASSPGRCSSNSVDRSPDKTHPRWSGAPFS